MLHQRVLIQSRIGILAPKIVVEGYSVPSPVDAFTYNPYRVDAHVVSPNTELPGVGLTYVDGPSATIFLRVGGVEYEIGKGEAVATYYEEPQPECTRFSQSGEMFYPMAGTYTVWAAAGYVRPEEGVFYVTDRVELFVEANPIQVATKTVKYVTEAPIPMWIWLAAAAGGALLAGVVIAEVTRPR